MLAADKLGKALPDREPEFPAPGNVHPGLVAAGLRRSAGRIVAAADPGDPARQECGPGLVAAGGDGRLVAADHGQGPGPARQLREHHGVVEPVDRGAGGDQVEAAVGAIGLRRPAGPGDAAVPAAIRRLPGLDHRHGRIERHHLGEVIGQDNGDLARPAAQIQRPPAPCHLPEQELIELRRIGRPGGIAAGDVGIGEGRGDGPALRLRGGDVTGTMHGVLRWPAFSSACPMGPYDRRRHRGGRCSNPGWRSLSLFAPRATYRHSQASDVKYNFVAAGRRAPSACRAP